MFFLKPWLSRPMLKASKVYRKYDRIALLTLKAVAGSITVNDRQIIRPIDKLQNRQIIAKFSKFP